MRIILRSLMYLAGLGLFLSLILHISGLLGVIPSAYIGQAAQAARYLNLVMMVVCLVSIFLSNRMSENYPLKEFWKATLRGCPDWLKYLPVCLLAYAFLFATLNQGGKGHGVPGSLLRVQESAAFGIAIYALCLAIFYSALHVQGVEETRKCPNGHEVSPTVKFCEECGAKISEFSDLDKQRDAS